MDEAVALEFMADVEEAVASIQELSATAQELATTAQEAADEVAVMREAAVADAEATNLLAEAMDRLTAAVDANTAATDANAGATEGAAAKSSAAASSHGRYKLALVGVAVAAGLAVAGAAQFQAQTTRLVTSAGELPGNLAMVQEGMLKISAATATSTSEMAGGMYTVESAGFHGAQGLIVLKAAAQGAKDEGAELSVVANAVTDALVDFHQPASAAANVTSQLIKAVSFGKTNFEEFSGSMSNILPLAAAMHLKLADVSGVLAEMTAHGMSAQRASEDEANAMRSLMAPTGVMTKEYKLMGISAQEVQAHLGKVGLSGTMEWLSQVAQKGAKDVGQNYTQALDKLMGTAPGLVTALMTTGKNAGETTAAIKGIAGASADAKGNVDGFSQVQQTLAFKTKAAEESLKAAGITLGMALLPAVVAIVGPITHMLQLIAGNKVAADALAVVVGGVLAGALGGKLAGAFKDVKAGVEGASTAIEWLIGKMTATTAATEAQTAATEVQTGATEAGAAAQTEMDVAMDANPIGLIILAIVALVIAVYELVRHWRGVVTGFKVGAHEIAAVFDIVRHAIAAAADWIRDHWKVIVAWLVDPIGMAVHEILTHSHQIAHIFDDVRHDVAHILDNFRHDIASFAESVPRQIWASFVLAWHLAVRAAELLWHGVVWWITTLLHFYEQLPGRITSFLEKLPGEMLTIGKNVIMGLIHGIEDAASAIPSLMSGLAHTVESYFTNPLKLFSPSRRFFEHGANTVKGYILGALSQVSALQSVMRGLGSGIAAGGIGGLGAGGAAGGTAPSVHVQVPVTMQGVAQIYNTPQFLQYMQTIVQEAVLRYQLNNPSSGLLAPGRGF